MTAPAAPRIDSLVSLLAARSADPGGYTVADGEHSRFLSFAQLERDSSTVAAALQARPGWDATPGPAQAVVLALADPLAFITAFFGIAKAGAIPVPGPVNAASNASHLKRLRNIVSASNPSLVITEKLHQTALEDALRELGIGVTSPLALVSAGSASPFMPVPSADTAYVQYTSGSISDPKPIPLRQRHVLAQLRQAQAAFGEDASCVSVNWVPLYHDMGLVTSVLRPLWSGYTSVILDPFAFVRDPSIWLEAMSSWRATHTSAPDFGYALCVRKVAAPERYDLSTLRVARSAGEMVRASTLREFAEKFRAAGFDHRAFKPSYGLAEATLTVTACPLDEAATIHAFSRSALRKGLIEPPADPDDVTPLVCCGEPLRDTQVRILAEDGEPARAEGVLGEVWIRGPQVLADGDDRAGRRTGDLGFLWQGRLVLVGRSRDRFQVRGENYYSAEIESTVVACDGALRPGRCAVVLLHDGSAQDTVGVVAELKGGHAPTEQDRADLTKRITREVGKAFGLAPHRVLLVAAGTLPVTTSGKLKREACRELLEAGRAERPLARQTPTS